MSSTAGWRRHALGFVSLALVAGGVAIELVPGLSEDWAFAQGVCVKAGTVLLMAWLAYPQLVRLSAWKTAGVLICGSLIVFRPQLIPVLLRILILLAPLLVIIWLLRVPSKGRSSR